MGPYLGTRVPIGTFLTIWVPKWSLFSPVFCLMITDYFPLRTYFLLTTLGWIRAFVANPVVSRLRVILNKDFIKAVRGGGHRFMKLFHKIPLFFREGFPYLSFHLAVLVSSVRSSLCVLAIGQATLWIFTQPNVSATAVALNCQNITNATHCNWHNARNSGKKQTHGTIIIWKIATRSPDFLVLEY